MPVNNQSSVPYKTYDLSNKQSWDRRRILYASGSANELSRQLNKIGCSEVAFGFLFRQRVDL